MRKPATSLRSDSGIVVRTPLLPWETFSEWATAGDLSAQRRWLAALIDRPEVREALFLASPELSDRIERWRREPAEQANRGIERALVKYVTRMIGRSTPFGLFAGVTAGALGQATSLELGPCEAYRRHTRLDNDYLLALGDAIARSARGNLVWLPNSSLYEVAGRYRYAHARLHNQQRSYHLVSVEPTSYLRASLERALTGARLDDLVAALERHDATISNDEASAYINELIDAQLLVPDLGSSITGGEPVEGFIKRLGGAGLEMPRSILAAARSQLARLDERFGNSPEAYRALAGVLAALPAKPQIARLYQVDMAKPGAATLAPTVVAEVARAIEWLRKTSRRRVNAALDDFRRRFSERYDGRTVPLAEVLDEENGIGFETSTALETENAPLLAELAFPEKSPPARVEWDHRDVHLQRRLARLAPSAELVLNDEDTHALAVATPPAGPDALSAMIRLAGTPQEVARGEFQVLLEGVTGPSGARILGRFCHTDPAIDKMVRSHLRAEEALRPDVVFAELVHLNEGRTGNIVCRPVLRHYEIVYLGVSGAPADRQLPLDDLQISLRAERIVLTSRRLGVEVVPRLSTAHNFRLRSLGVYGFLCALQNQADDVTGGWSWGKLDTLPALPRVRLGKVILSRATWTLDAGDLRPIAAATRSGTGATAVAVLRVRLGLPRWIALSQGDNELPVDLENPMLAAVLADELSRTRTASLVEVFPPPEALPVHGPEGHYTNEIVLLYTRVIEPRRIHEEQPTASVVVRRSFPPGSPWLYAKLYAGAATIDRVLRALAPTIRTFLKRGDATHWFFVRYQDPSTHLRLRFAGEAHRLAATVLPALEGVIAPLLGSGVVWKMQLDTYERELERYGGAAGIDLCERLFWFDSEAVLSILELLTGDSGAEARWKLCVRGCDQLLEALGLDEPERRTLFTRARDALGREHDADAALFARVGERWKQERADLNFLLARDATIDAEHPFAPALTILNQRSALLAELAPVLRAVPDFKDLAWSLVHMHANRLLHASHRAQELVIYDLLRRWHDARAARGRRGT